jgi:hypothetical protein
MAYNHDQKKMSYSFATLFSSDRKGNEYQLIKIGFNDGKLTFNYAKGTSGGGSEGADAYISLNFDTACALKNLFDMLIRQRIGKFRNGQAYDDVYFTYNITFQDKETRETRTAGSLTIKTESNPETNLNTVHIYFLNGVHTFDIALGAGFLPKSFTFTDDYFKDVDLHDSRLYSVAHLLDNIMKMWPALLQNDRIASLTITRLNAISEKLGISYDNKQGSDKGNYQEKYRSGSNTQNTEDDPF